MEPVEVVPVGDMLSPETAKIIAQQRAELTACLKKILEDDMINSLAMNTVELCEGDPSKVPSGCRCVLAGLANYAMMVLLREIADKHQAESRSRL